MGKREKKKEAKGSKEGIREGGEVVEIKGRFSDVKKERKSCGFLEVIKFGNV